MEKADTRRWWTWRRICPPDNYIIGQQVMKMLMLNKMLMSVLNTMLKKDVGVVLKLR